MANLTYRQATQVAPVSTTTKNATLTSQEIDGNFKSLNDELITKAPLVSPGLSGVPTAPTATAGTNTTQLATTAFVQTGLSGRQPLDAELTAISGLSANGLITRTGASTAASRSIAVSGTGLSVTNADGVAGNPTVTSNATAANTVSTIVARDASGNFSAGTITAALAGNAATATKLVTARTISLTGDVTGSVSFDGSANASITATVVDDSHNHIIANVDGLQTALDGKVAKDSNTGSATLPAGTTAQRSAVPVAGALRFNSTLTQFEGYDGTAWDAISKPDSSIVSFQQAGTGAAARTAQDKLREWVSVKDFGAVGDGSDATTAFAAALAAHDSIYVPAGTYAVTGITMSNNKVLFGDGEESVINCSGPIDFTDARKGGMRNLRVNLTSASTTLVRLQKGGGVGSFELYFEDVNFVGNIANASTVGIHITDSYINTFVNCLFIDFDKAIIHGVEANRNNYFGCSIRARTNYGTVLIEQTAGQANSFVGCDIENCNRMLDLSGGSVFFADGCYFEAHNAAFGVQLTGGHVGISRSYFNEVFIDLMANGSLELSKNWIKASSLSNAAHPVIRVRPNFSRLILDNNVIEGVTYLCRMNPTRYDYLQQYDAGAGNYVNAYPSNSQHLSIDDMIYDVDTAAIRQCRVDNVRAVRSRAECYSEGRVRFDGATGLQLVASNWNYNPLRLGANYLWVDTTGKLRIKNGAPAFDVDGTVVGTQT